MLFQSVPPRSWDKPMHTYSWLPIVMVNQISVNVLQLQNSGRVVWSTAWIIYEFDWHKATYNQQTWGGDCFWGEVGLLSPFSHPKFRWGGSPACPGISKNSSASTICSEVWGASHALYRQMTRKEKGISTPWKTDSKSSAPTVPSMIMGIPYKD